jgi:hypothetical protein
MTRGVESDRRLGAPFAADDRDAGDVVGLRRALRERRHALDDVLHQAARRTAARLEDRLLETLRAELRGTGASGFGDAVGERQSAS